MIGSVPKACADRQMSQEDKIAYLAGAKAVSKRPLAPYDGPLREFLNGLSLELRSFKEIADYHDIMSFAFWCRKANIDRLKEEFEDKRARLGRGLVFHIAPSNVPVNFAFSFAFGLLSGNANIVRLPSKDFKQVDIICAAINKLFNCGKYDQIKEMTAFVRYEQNEEITAEFCSNCSARVIWGGDETVRNIRKIPMPERGVELVFSDRYSFCVIDALSVDKLDAPGLRRLAEDFYNDTYLMDQNACSSAHLIVWLNGQGQAAKEKFWEAVHKIALEKYQLAPVNAVDKYTLFCRNAIEHDNISSFKRHGGCVYRVALDSLPDNMDALRGTSGYFYEYDTDDINSIAHIINTRYQTLTYFGMDRFQLFDFVINNRLTGIDRIVPIGKALDIGVIWDGYDIVKCLSRIIDVK